MNNCFNYFYLSSWQNTAVWDVRKLKKVWIKHLECGIFLRRPFWLFFFFTFMCYCLLASILTHRFDALWWMIWAGFFHVRNRKLRNVRHFKTTIKQRLISWHDSQITWSQNLPLLSEAAEKQPFSLKSQPLGFKCDAMCTFAAFKPRTCSDMHVLAHLYAIILLSFGFLFSK